MTVSCSPNVTKTLARALRPIFFRMAAGMSICPLAEVPTTGIEVHLLSIKFNIFGKGIPMQEAGNQADHGVGSRNISSVSKPRAAR